MNEKLVLASVYNGELRIEDVEVVKETPKQYQLSNAFRTKLNKDEMGKYIDHIGIFCFESQANELAKAYVEKEIKKTKSRIEQSTDLLSRLEESFKRLDSNG